MAVVVPEVVGISERVELRAGKLWLANMGGQTCKFSKFKYVISYYLFRYKNISTSSYCMFSKVQTFYIKYH